MEIRALDDVGLADDAQMRAFYDLNRRAELHGREESPYWSFEEFLAAVRSPDSSERQELFAVYDVSRMVGCGGLWSSLLENLDKAWAEVYVEPRERRRGIGRTLLARLEQIAKDDGRSMVLAQTNLPYDDRDGHPDRRFAEECGYELANYEVARHLALPVPDEHIQEWIDETAPHREGYTIETYVGAVPDDLVASLCVLMGQLAVDAPSGTVDFEEEVITPEVYAERIASTEAMGRARYETIALTAGRQVVAHSTLAMPREGGTHVYQWGTFVHREHRGHRLGLAVKAVNLRAVQAARSDLSLVITHNAETNDQMVAINDRMGFRPVEVTAEFVKRF